MIVVVCESVVVVVVVIHIAVQVRIEIAILTGHVKNKLRLTW